LKEKFGSSYVQPNDHFVLCDAGGGTVDLLSYKVTSVEPSFRVQEAAVGTGDKCGATFIDRNFKTWLKKKLGEKVYESIPAAKLQEGSKIRRDFENIKNNFDGGDEDQYLTLPKEAVREDVEENGFVDGELRLTCEDLTEIFNPCVNRTLELIDGQVAEIHKTGARVKCVFLVGGFGKSNYLFKKIEEYAVERGFSAMRPANPWSAVARGAVARGLEPDGAGMVELRFIPGVHSESDAYIDELTGEKRARGQMRCKFKIEGNATDSVLTIHLIRASKYGRSIDR
jgi:molecular chaperone DnaK (HSP70)